MELKPPNIVVVIIQLHATSSKIKSPFSSDNLNLKLRQIMVNIIKFRSIFLYRMEAWALKVAV